jgi:carboxypeptidase C (cathepsin A)
MAFVCPVLAQDTATKAASRPVEKQADAKDNLVHTSHAATIGGKQIEYEATAGTLELKDAADKPTAKMFFVAYTKSGVTNVSDRPLAFAFNGGPGSSAVWLHMGCLGPKRIDYGESGANVSPPYRTIDNESSLLDATDLVFIDPVSTGFSRAAPGQDARKFHGVSEDVRSVGELIRLYVTRFKRWDSPKFIIGETYGTTRASGLVDHMQTELGMYFNGVILIAPALNFQTILFGDGNDLPYIMFLPGYAATAWYHKKLSDDLQADFHKAVREAKGFALADYSVALLKGTSLSQAERQSIAQRMARYTGLDVDFVLRKNLRVNSEEFNKELLRKERRLVGRLDSRLTAPFSDDPLHTLHSDPSHTVLRGSFTAAFNEYLNRELHYASEKQYEVVNLSVQPWEWGEAKNSYLDVSGRLWQALTTNKDLRVLFAAGYYDLATPFLCAEYTINHLHLLSELQPRVSVAYYEAGHMMYIHAESRYKLKQDLARFIDSTRRKETLEVGSRSTRGQ